MSRPHLRYLLLDGFDPDTGELALRVGAHGGEDLGPQVLRLKLHLGRSGDALQPLRRELTTHVQMPLPPAWEKGLKLIIRAIEDELAAAEGRDPLRYLWVQTQVLHPTDPRRSTLNHPIPAQTEILWDWAQRLEQEEDLARATEVLERLLLLAPRHVTALSRLAFLLRQQRMVEELLDVTARWVQADPGNAEPLLRRGEALLALERPVEALEGFRKVLKVQPLHLLAHLGAAQAQAQLGGDPFPHLDAAMELDAAATRAVLEETFDYRILGPLRNDRRLAPEDLPQQLGLSAPEIRVLAANHGLPLGEDGSVRESELARWVGIQNRCQLRAAGLHWIAPTPRILPEPPPEALPGAE
ncbi:MAG: hypothetical protein HY823_07615 [Acidobacteria bacterium]|nr:hypothetical protein [Acidobacteriota bacterium]